MNPHLLIIAIGLFYIVVFGGLSLLRREGLSAQFAIEVVLITALVEAIALLTSTIVDPLPFLIFIYIPRRRKVSTDASAGRLLIVTYTRVAK